MFRHSLNVFARCKSQILAVVLSLIATVVLTGCGGIDGTYSGTQGGETMTIVLDGGKYTMSVKSPGGGDAKPSTGDYTVDGKSLTLQGAIPLPFTIDGKKLIGPFGITLTKQ